MRREQINQSLSNIRKSVNRMYGSGSALEYNTDLNYIMEKLLEIEKYNEERMAMRMRKAADAIQLNLDDTSKA